MDEGRFSAVGRFGTQADKNLAKPTPEGHRAIAQSHREASAALRQMASEESRPELRASLEKAANHHDHAEGRHELAAKMLEDPKQDDGVKKDMSETATDMTHIADGLTDKAQAAYAWAKPVFNFHFGRHRSA